MAMLMGSYPCPPSNLIVHTCLPSLVSLLYVCSILLGLGDVADPSDRSIAAVNLVSIYAALDGAWWT